MTVLYVVIAVVVIVVVSIVGVVTLAALGKPTSDVIQFIGIIIGATIPSLFALAQLYRMREEVREVHDQVNGRMSELVEKLPDPKDRREARDALRETSSK